MGKGKTIANGYSSLSAVKNMLAICGVARKVALSCTGQAVPVASSRMGKGKTIANGYSSLSAVKNMLAICGVARKVALSCTGQSVGGSQYVYYSGAKLSQIGIVFCRR